VRQRERDRDTSTLKEKRSHGSHGLQNGYDDSLFTPSRFCFSALALDTIAAALNQLDNARVADTVFVRGLGGWVGAVAAWQVMSQLRILFTGVVYDTMARWNFFGAGMRRLTETEWVGLAVLFLAEAIAAGDDLTSQSAIKVCVRGRDVKAKVDGLLPR
jgi:hypothetical protein